MTLYHCRSCVVSDYCAVLGGSQVESVMVCVKVLASMSVNSHKQISRLLMVGPGRSTRLQHRPQSHTGKTALRQTPAIGTHWIPLCDVSDSSRLVPRPKRQPAVPVHGSLNRSMLAAQRPLHFHHFRLSNGVYHPRSFR